MLGGSSSKTSVAPNSCLSRSRSSSSESVAASSTLSASTWNASSSEWPVTARSAACEATLAVNDVSFHRRPDERVAELAYSVEGEQLGRVRCDGLVASTPAGSTGYNLANGGPVLAWGVQGFVVSFIAPHTLTARALVVATDAVLTVQNLSPRHGVDVTIDGRTTHALEPQDHMDVRFRDEQALLAQVPGTTFYGRLRDKFGRLAS